MTSGSNKYRFWEKHKGKDKLQIHDHRDIGSRNEEREKLQLIEIDLYSFVP
jgi:hypothetical protein